MHGTLLPVPPHQHMPPGTSGGQCCTTDTIANGTGLETDDVMWPTSVTGVCFLDSV